MVSDRALVYVPQPIDEAALSVLEQEARVIRGYGEDARPLHEVLPEVEILLVRTEKLSADVIAAAPRLRFIQRVGIGIDGIDVQAATDAGVAVFNTAGGNVRTVAEMTIGLALAVARGIPYWDQAVRRGEFAKREQNPGRQLHGKTWGVVGLGNIGSAVAHIAGIGLGMEVLAYHPTRSKEWIEDRGAIAIDGLSELMTQSDVVSLHVPRTDETRGLVGAAELAWLRPQAILVNMSRGGVVDEAALLAVLQERRIAGAAIDVWQEEPPPADHPFMSLENVVLSPHRGGRTVEATEVQGAQAVTRVINLLREPSVEDAINGASLMKTEV